MSLMNLFLLSFCTLDEDIFLWRVMTLEYLSAKGFQQTILNMHTCIDFPGSIIMVKTK